jgi:hypothetical protein
MFNREQTGRMKPQREKPDQRPGFAAGQERNVGCDINNLGTPFR